KRYLDLQTLLKQTSDPKAIEDIRLEMEMLERRSGLTNKEFNEMLALNSELVQKFPETGNEISKLGNKLVTTTDQMREMNATQREMLMMETMKKLSDGAAEYEDWLKKIDKLTKEINENSRKAQKIDTEIAGMKLERKKIQDKINAAMKGEIVLTVEEQNELYKKLDTLRKNLDARQ